MKKAVSDPDHNSLVRLWSLVEISNIISCATLLTKAWVRIWEWASGMGSILSVVSWVRICSFHQVVKVLVMHRKNLLLNWSLLHPQSSTCCLGKTTAPGFRGTTKDARAIAKGLSHLVGDLWEMTSEGQSPLQLFSSQLSSKGMNRLSFFSKYFSGPIIARSS